MSIQIAPQDEKRILKLVESGDYPDAADVIHEAIVRLEDELKIRRLRALIQEGQDEYQRGDYEVWTPELRERIWAEAREMVRLGVPIDPNVCP